MDRVRLLVLTPLLLLAGAAPASAATFCVQDPACPADGIDRPSVDAALESASERFGLPDTVRVGPGDFTVSGTAAILARDSVTGAGAGRTTIVGGFDLTSADTALRDLTVRLAPGQDVGVQASGAVSGVAIDGPEGVGADAAGFVGGSRGSFRDGSIRMAAGVGARGDNLGPTFVAGATIVAPVGAEDIDVLRTRITATTAGARSRAVPVNLDAVLIDLAGPDATGVIVGGGQRLDSVVSHVTIRGTGAEQTGLAAVGGCETGLAQLTADTTVITGVGVALRRDSACTTSPGGSAPASLTVTRSAFDPAAVVSGGPGNSAIEPPVAAAPDLDADGLPVAGSPLVDAGDPAEAAATDLVGTVRPADGDGDGTAIADVGALERPAIPVPEPPAPVPAPGSTGDAPPAASGGVLGTSAGRVAPGRPTLRLVPYKAKRPGRYEARAQLRFPAGTSPSGGRATLYVTVGKRTLATVRAKVDRRGRAAFKLRIPRGVKRSRVRLEVRFAGTDTLTAITSGRVRLPGTM